MEDGVAERDGEIICCPLFISIIYCELTNRRYRKASVKNGGSSWSGSPSDNAINASIVLVCVSVQIIMELKIVESWT